MIDNGFACNRIGSGHKFGAADCPACHVHQWRVEGDGNYEPYHNVCELCGEREPDPLEEAAND